MFQFQKSLDTAGEVLLYYLRHKCFVWNFVFLRTVHCDTIIECKPTKCTNSVHFVGLHYMIVLYG